MIRRPAFAPVFLALPLAAALAVAGCTGEPVDNSAYVEDEDLEGFEDELAMDAELTLSGFELRLPVVEGRPGVIYGNILGGSSADEVIGLSVAGARVELHDTLTAEDGTMSMEQQDRVTIEPNGTLTLARGGYHGMVYDIPEEFAAMEMIPVTVSFANAGDRTVDARVDSIAGGAAMDATEAIEAEGTEGVQ
ncbi:MAG: copper chaperone PCu(A)C [Pacificimonas sp.]|jgi:copper(I)-binding protein|nr:copper chaperone PCu(A)C [Pacificimonas sp.]